MQQKNKQNLFYSTASVATNLCKKTEEATKFQDKCIDVDFIVQILFNIIFRVERKN